jgi:aspartate racemase
MSKVARIGLLGGMSWVSSLEYYRIINTRILDLTAGRSAADLILFSFDTVHIEAFIARQDWRAIAGELLAARAHLLAAGARVVAVASNTIHNAVDPREWTTGPAFVHIFAATLDEIRRRDVRCVGLIGTSATLRGRTYAPLIRGDAGIRCLVPDEALWSDLDRIIFDELCRDARKAASARLVEAEVERLQDCGAECIVLACTELRELVAFDQAVPLIDTTEVHARAIAERSVALAV